MQRYFKEISQDLEEPNCHKYFSSCSLLSNRYMYIFLFWYINLNNKISRSKPRQSLLNPRVFFCIILPDSGACSYSSTEWRRLFGDDLTRVRGVFYNEYKLILISNFLHLPVKEYLSIFKLNAFYFLLHLLVCELQNTSSILSKSTVLQF